MEWICKLNMKMICYIYIALKLIASSLCVNPARNGGNVFMTLRLDSCFINILEQQKIEVLIFLEEIEFYMRRKKTFKSNLGLKSHQKVPDLLDVSALLNYIPPTFC